MHLYTVSHQLQQTLLSRDETGMGYQIAELHKPYEYERHRYVVLNAEIAFRTNEREEFTMLFHSRSYSYIKAQATGNITLMFDKVLSRTEWHSVLNESTAWPSTPAKDSKVEYAADKEKFVRLSAYEDDKRVDKVNRKFLPGTYATTEADYILCVSTSDDPVERYALPNDELIQYAFYNQPKSNDKLQRGTVEPANGKRGGGKEVIFPDGTSNETYLGMVLYGNFM